MRPILTEIKSFIAKIILYTALYLFKLAFKLNPDYKLPAEREAELREAEARRWASIVPFRVRFAGRTRLMRVRQLTRLGGLRGVS